MWWPHWLTYSGHFTHKVVTCQPQSRRRSGKVCQPKTNVLTTESMEVGVSYQQSAVHVFGGGVDGRVVRWMQAEVDQLISDNWRTTQHAVAGRRTLLHFVRRQLHIDTELASKCQTLIWIDKWTNRASWFHSIIRQLNQQWSFHIGWGVKLYSLAHSAKSELSLIFGTNNPDKH